MDQMGSHVLTKGEGTGREEARWEGDTIGERAGPARHPRHRMKRGVARTAVGVVLCAV